MKKIWKLVLFILIIVIAFFLPVILPYLATTLGGMLGVTVSAATLATLASVPMWVGAVVGLGAAYLIDPSTTTEIVKDVGDVATQVGKTAISAAGSVLSSSTILLVGAAAAAAYFLFGKKKKKKSADQDTAVILPATPPAIGAGGAA